MNYKCHQFSVISFQMFILLCLLFSIFNTVKAQEISHTSWEIYVERDIDANGTDRLLFLNLLTGDITTAEVIGERFTPLNDYILYYDLVNRAVMTAYPDGTLSQHPFIQAQNARRVDWVISSDNRLIAWTLTYGEANTLSTITSIATPTGTNQRVVLNDGPRSDGARVLPVAFSVDNSALILDSQPDAIGDLAPYRQYASLFRLSLSDSEISLLPDEPHCFCAAALRAGEFVRLFATPFGFDVHVYDLESGLSQTIASPNLIDYTLGGNILISPDGDRVVYALSQVDIRTTPITIKTVLMLVDLERMSQAQLSEPIRSYVYPIKWTEDNTAILFIIPDHNGTWKIDLNSGELLRVAEASYVGVLED
jgi:hypothetical protein